MQIKSKTLQDPVVELKGVTKTYRSRSSFFTLEPIDLAVNLGEITVAVGENGSGKSTLLGLVAGALKSDRGTLRYPLLGQANLYAIRQQIAYIPYELPKWEGLALDCLHFSATIHGIKAKRNEQQVNKRQYIKLVALPKKNLDSASFFSFDWGELYYKLKSSSHKDASPSKEAR